MNINSAEKLIKLEDFDNLLVGLDIGGTLAKLSIAVKKNFDEESILLLKDKEFEEINLEENILYIKQYHTSSFQTDVMEFLIFLKKKYFLPKINVTGGGAFKFSKQLNEEIGVIIEKRDELISLVKGYTFMNKYNSFYEQKEGKVSVVKEEEFIYPHISVNIGSGISILIVNSINEIKRETGTLIGGGIIKVNIIGTLIGLGKILLGIDNFDDIMSLAEKGDNKNIDLLIKDIYGGSAKNLDGDVIASSFAKIGDLQFQDKTNAKKEDIAKSLLLMICFNIGQLAYLVGIANKINRIYVYGNFTRRYSYAIECLDYAIKFWNKEFVVHFNKYDGFLGSIGCLLQQ